MGVVILPGFEIPDSEIELTYARSSGPGGQNVNKVNTKAVLRWNLLASACIPPFTRARLLEKLSGKLTRAGELLIASDRHRDQAQNRDDCFEKLAAMLRAAARPEKERRETKATRSSQRRRVNEKKREGEKKRLRGKPSDY